MIQQAASHIQLLAAKRPCEDAAKRSQSENTLYAPTTTSTSQPIIADGEYKGNMTSPKVSRLIKKMRKED